MPGGGPYQRLVIVVRVMMAKTANAGDAEGRLRVAVLDVWQSSAAAYGDAAPCKYL